MMKLEYAGGEVLVSDEASHVILRYAESLAMHNASDTISIPVVTVEGVPGVAEILIGPASQLLALPSAALQPSRAVASNPESSSQVADDMELGWP
jgi:hypothetical protein